MQEPSTSPAPPVARNPTPLHYIFAIDISWTAGRCGLVQEVVAGLKALLYPEEYEGEAPRKGLPDGAKIAIMTFDRTVQFYNLKVRSLSFRIAPS